MWSEISCFRDSARPDRRPSRGTYPRNMSAGALFISLRKLRGRRIEESCLLRRDRLDPFANPDSYPAAVQRAARLLDALVGAHQNTHVCGAGQGGIPGRGSCVVAKTNREGDAFRGHPLILGGASHRRYRLSAIGYRLSAIGYRLSAI